MILQLMQEGKIELNGVIGTYLPDYTGAAKNKVSIENLLTYSSGMPNCESYIGEKIYSIPLTQELFIKNYCSGAPDTTPGTRFSYNNGDYIILGSIIEKVTGKSFQKNLKERILLPLKMKNTGVLPGAAEPAGLVHSYEYNDSLKKFSPDRPYRIENYFAAGAMYSTAED